MWCKRFVSPDLLRLPETSSPVIEKQEGVGCVGAVRYRYHKIGLTIAVEVAGGRKSQVLAVGITRRRCEKPPAPLLRIVHTLREPEPSALVSSSLIATISSAPSPFRSAVARSLTKGLSPGKFNKLIGDPNPPSLAPGKNDNPSLPESDPDCDQVEKRILIEVLNQNLFAVKVARQIDARCHIETDRIAGVELLKYFEPEAGDRNCPAARSVCRLDFEFHCSAAIACGRRSEFDPRRIARRCPRALMVRTFERHIADTACSGEANGWSLKGRMSRRLPRNSPAGRFAAY